jgi:hypothetical protein
MGWYKVEGTNIRCNGKRYLNGQAYDLDDKIAKLNDHFVPCAAPAKAAVPIESPPKAAKKTEAPKTEAPKPKTDAFTK